MIETQYDPRHTLGSDPMDPTDPTDPKHLRNEWSEADRSGNATDEQGSIVPVGSVVPFSEVRRALFTDAASATEKKPLSATGGGEEPAISDADDCWIIDAEAAAMLDELEEVSFDDVPVCSRGRYCDVQTLDDAWHCSHCDPNAEKRRKRTQRLLAATERIRRDNGPPESNVTHADPQP